MRKIIAFLLLVVFISSCDKRSKVEKAIDEIPVGKIEVVRYEKAFFATKPEDLPKLKAQYPEFFPPGFSDSVYVDKLTQPLWRELYNEVEKKYSNFEPQKKEIEELYRHIKYYYPNEPLPKVYTLINDMDNYAKALYSGNNILISLEMYLGKDHKFYDYPAYLKQNFTEKQMMPDIVTAFAANRIPQPQDKSLISFMVTAGKELYMKDLLLPDYSDADKIGYTPEQIAFCQENEGEMWSRFVEEKYLFSTDSKLEKQFIDPAPFSKFYLEIDNETPGRIGTWVGWQIVRAYMKENDVTLQKMLLTDPVEIFNKSKYKPKK
ncbi:gliding motility lipoprotein GldB [Flavobacterium sp. 3HN19-14]|uniref:gliding motility lipoprotein GldB n=1 Tax=Flavobacterium sp. 3HN19-14 TaxID=3448133 RepID=UPI003EE01D81